MSQRNLLRARKEQAKEALNIMTTTINKVAGDIDPTKGVSGKWCKETLEAISEQLKKIKTDIL